MKPKVSLPSQVRPIFLTYYCVFVVLPFIYGLFFSDFRLDLQFFGQRGVSGGLLLILLAFGLSLVVFYNMEKSQFPQVRLQAWATVISAVVGVVIYIVLLGPAQTLTSFAVFAVVEIVAILVAVALMSIRENRNWSGKNRTDEAQQNLLRSIFYGLFLLIYPVYIFYVTIPEGGNMRIIFIIYSSALFLWKIVRAYRSIRKISLPS